MDGREQSNFDEAGAMLADSYPPFWRRMYCNLLKENFNEAESLKLVQTYILSQCSNGIRGSDG